MGLPGLGSRRGWGRYRGPETRQASVNRQGGIYARRMLYVKRIMREANKIYLTLGMLGFLLFAAEPEGSVAGREYPAAKTAARGAK